MDKGNIYQLTLSDKVMGMIKAIIYLLASAYVFYRSVYGVIPAIPIGIYVYMLDRKRRIEKKRMRVLDQFKNMLSSVQGALEAGCSMEKAMLMARNDLVEMYGGELEIVKELGNLEKKLRLNITLEQALAEMADVLELQEVYEFVEVISITLRTGGNTVQIIKDTVVRIVESIELDAELEVMVAGKKLEQQVMVYMPAVIIVFLGFTGGEFMNPLYQGRTGRILMTVVLAGNVMADYIGKKIIDVR